MTQVAIRIQTDQGSNFNGLCANYDSDCLLKLFLPYLKTIKVCYNTEKGCFHDNTNGMPIKLLSRVPVGFDPDASIILTDGALMDFYQISSDCSGTGINWFGFSLPTTLDCSIIIVDVNGFKLPNTMGKDIFFFHIQEKGITPYGLNDGLSTQCVTKPPSGSGTGCAAKILYE